MNQQKRTHSLNVFPYTQVIVVGGNGQIGRRLLEQLEELPDVRIVATSRQGRPSAADSERIRWGTLDLEASDAQLREQLGELKKLLVPQAKTALIVTAALTDVDGCEADPERCRRVNEQSTAVLMYWARANTSAKVVFFSSDYVFDGAAGPYSEEQRRAPVSAYGRSKAFIEEWLERIIPDSLIVRTTGVFDYLPASKNFLMRVLELCRQGKTVTLPADQTGNPVWARDVARATLELLARDAKGVFHVAGGADLARDEFGRTIARVFGCDSALISSVTTGELGQKARRPLRGGLRCEKLRSELGWAPPSAVEVLDRLKKSAT